ncbi:MAG: 23S rRNA (guanosine(2251)-2'-O)-methyltransferase RlmB [Clostridiales bacterium]|nr:23S rRNA (guanosine(2251)-2'-O)-methyltransferase RlmB [Clostridiales bacterium]
MAEIIIGRNAVLEALKNGREIEKITVAKGADGSVKQIIGKAKDKKIPLYYSERNRMDKATDGENHQGVIAVVSDYKYCSVEDILDRAVERGEKPFILVLDGLEDPHNLGAILRSAECAGVHGLIIPKRRSVSVTETVAKTSAGACEYMLCAKVTNIAREIDKLKEQGIWIGACDMDGVHYDKQDMTGAVCLVVGGEGNGVSRLVKEKCDFVVSIPMKGKISSLNASNAASILMYEIVRQRG